MFIFIDSREKPRAIQKTILEFERQGIRYVTNKLYIGDYQNPANPFLVVERKANIAEIAQNAISGHARFKRELERLDDVGGKMYILIEQDKIDGKPVTCLEDIILWAPKFSEVMGDRIYRILKSWQNKHNVEYVFCAKKDTGRKIVELLGGGKV